MQSHKILMKFLNLNIEKNKVFNLNSLQIFIFSFLICLSFYALEGLLGIDRFYHPDSEYYLNFYSNIEFKDYLDDPFKVFKVDYLLITNLFNNNYYLLILLNFILYSLTNILIYQKVFKRYHKRLDNLKLFFLFYILFLDPYRLHLSSHILKETFIFSFIILIILSNKNIIKLLSIIFIDSFRPNSWIYVLIFITYSNIKKLLKPKIIYAILVLIVLSIACIILTDQSLNKIIHYQFENIISTLKEYYNREMPVRVYDHVPDFKNYGFPVGFILKNITWPIMLLSGFFMLYVSSLIFKLLGIIMLLNNFLIYFITKKTFISIGLLIILVMISVYTSSFTSMFRYSYIAIHSSIIYFFLNLNIKNLGSISK